jgi:hypothetical protein
MNPLLTSFRIHRMLSGGSEDRERTNKLRKTPGLDEGDFVMTVRYWLQGRRPEQEDRAAA